MDYTLYDVLDGMELPLDCEIPLDIDYIVLDIIANANDDYIPRRELAISYIEGWVNTHLVKDYHGIPGAENYNLTLGDFVEEYVGEWYDDQYSNQYSN